MLEHIGTYRSLLAQPPSMFVFEELCDALLAHPPDEEAIAYLAQHLARWPASEPRRAPWEWVEMVKQGHNCPEMQLCTMLEARDRSFDSFQEFARLIGSPHLDDVRWLELSDNALDDAWASSLGTSDAMPVLEHLYLNGCQLTDGALAHVLRSDTMSLRTLEVGANLFGDAAGHHVASVRSCVHLERLVLSHSSCPPRSFIELCTMPALTYLELRACRLSDVSVASDLPRARFLATLEHLGLSGNPLSTETLGQLAMSLKDMTRLSSLDVSALDQLNRSFISRLVAHPPPALEQLFLSRTGFDDACAGLLAATPELAGLTLLDVRQTKVTRHGVALLARACVEWGAELLCDEALRT